MKSLEATRLSITVKEARKILGAKYKDRSEKEIRDLIKELDRLSKIVLQNSRKTLLRESKLSKIK